MGFYDTYKNVLEAAKAAFEKVEGIENVVLSELYKITSLPMVIIDPAVTPINKGAVGGKLQLAIRFDTIILVKANEPDDWLEDVVEPMGLVVDKILSDKTLGGAVLDVFPRRFTPRSLSVRGKLYYGGVIQFEATVFHS